MEHKNFNQEKEILFNALYSSRGIQHIVDVATGLFKNPIVVADISNKVLAKTKDFTFTGLLEPSTNDPVMLSESLFRSTMRNRLPQRFRDNEQHPLLEQMEGGKCYCVCLLVIRSTVIGHLAICEVQTKITEEIFPLAEYLAQVLALELQKSNQNLTVGFATSRMLLKDLLEKRLSTPASIQQRLEQLDWHPKADFCLALIQDRDQKPTEFLLQSTIDYLRLIFPNCLCALNEIGIILLLTMERNEELSKFDLPMLEEFLTDCNQRCGFSHVFYELTGVADTYQQALCALKIAEKMQWPAKIVRFSDCAIYALLDEYGKSFDLKSLCMPTMLLLHEYDKTHKTPLIPTLRCFLDSGMDYNHTAKALFIHRNSLTYRLEKIKSILCLPAFSGNCIQQLQLSLRIFEYLDAMGW